MWESVIASLENRTGYYNIIFRFGGRKFTRSLETKETDEAERRRANLEQTIRDVKSGRLQVPADAGIATFLLSDGRLTEPLLVPEEAESPASLQAVLAEFFESLSDGQLEESTVNGMRIHERHLLRFFGEEFLADELSLDQLEKYAKRRLREKHNGRKAGPATIKKELVTLRRVWGWAQKRGKVSVVFPAIKDVELPKTSERPPFRTWGEIEQQIEAEQLSASAQKALWDCLYLDRNQIAKLLEHIQDHAKHEFLYPMAVLAAHTGARRSELMRSRKSDIQGDTIVIRERKRVRGQETTRRVPMSSLLKSVLEEWVAKHPGGSHTFCLGHVERSRKGKSKDSCRVGVQSLTRDEANHHFKRVLGNSKWQVIRGWHCLRHSFISNLACQGIDQRLIDEFVGHTSEAMRRRYTHLFPDSKRAAITFVFG